MKIPHANIFDVFNKSINSTYPFSDNITGGTYRLNRSDGNFKSFDLQQVLSKLKNATKYGLFNFTETYLESPLWPSLTPHNWSEQAVKLLGQPEYIVMLILCMFALIMNVLSIIAVTHIQNEQTMHLKLIINLAASDIFIVLSVLLHIINKIFNNPYPVGPTQPQDRITNSCVFATISSINIMSFLISLLNLLTMAVDHYIAIIKPLRYHIIMSKRHGYLLITTLWLTAALGGFSNFMVGSSGYDSTQSLFNYCEYIMYDQYHAEFLVFAVTIVCSFGITFIYLRIYFEVRKVQSKTHASLNDCLHSKKAMITTLLIIGTFSICWLPYCIFQITMIIQIHFNDKVVYKLFSTFLLISKYLYILQLLNCLLDPIIYAVRLSTVKMGYKKFLAKLRKGCKNTKSCILENDSLIPRAVSNSFSSRRTTMPQIASPGKISSMQNYDARTTTYEFIITMQQKHSHSNSDGCKSTKLSEGSDINENEIVSENENIAMVTHHVPCETQLTLLNHEMNETLL